ncbi:hypothetical protein V6N13_121907 [Hibiscus sabdariffa]
MGLSNMKALLVCLTLISMVLIQVNAVAAGATRYIHPAVLDHCKRPGGPHPGCHPDPKGPLKQANRYNRGCSRHHRCRS